MRHGLIQGARTSSGLRLDVKIVDQSVDVVTDSAALCLT